MKQSIALAHPNIAFIKYWGNLDESLRIPLNGSISINLAALTTRTSVFCNQDLTEDELILNGTRQTGSVLLRVCRFLDVVRGLVGTYPHARVESRNDFPTGAGIASSASAFAALALAASAAYGLELSEKDLSRLARRGSGSACRSVPAGFTEWQVGTSDQDSFATSFARADHWQLMDLIAVIHSGEKKAGSTEGHHIAATSPVQAGRVADAPRRLDDCRQAILSKDFERLASVMEQDSNLLHAVMMTSNPALYYWRGGTVEVMNAVRTWRKQGFPCAFTIDAGPNVHVICPTGDGPRLESRLREIPEVESVLVSGVGGGAVLLSD
jgi:diphosphomevalonate decarboxylase